jgi:hypothetical protein
MSNKKTYPFAPGSNEAIKSGCQCPVEDNNNGLGAYMDTIGNPVFWYNFDCPIHGKAQEIDANTILKEKE